ncbi:CDP-diacylglycerol--glycerol-3-phosphate 3-phosphatidyltransferase [Schaalia odontolytica]|uniref:CDP-diacylglycerol--glycerol-3-phosphate 3-phosphatidyltransferase n=2 Tax=Schaalia odontolytica TaxID=1660 RepID=A0A857A8H8_9ACTO|nr:CDP-diacylglycerol--glycerol-3-phosphate 3-phosphatidyltransferase [Schaalia odontolytica]EFF79202.1 CDP-diacylglycerol--glycerol-3-phosphate 3-phosphatidyltransferase [Schaalia odontolytica F0309]QGS10775.1 CDP-diacylglycerol--glycerol-3-phosphate 3-phosphatidyltransferase [Schaalia odontolytica]
MSENVSRVQRGSKVPVVNLPNALTVLRLVLVPVFVVLGLQSASWTALWAAFVVFAVAAITDRFDGKLARSWGQITDFGRIADPIADKALTLCGFALLSYQGYLPWWVTILIAVRELGITAMRAFFLRRGVVVSANQAGKLKTFMQMVALGTLLIPWAHFKHINDGNEWWVVLLIRLGQIFAGVALALTLYSGFMYVIDGVRLMRGASADEAVGDSRDNDAPEEPAPSRRGTAGQHLQS